MQVAFQLEELARYHERRAEELLSLPQAHRWGSYGEDGPSIEDMDKGKWHADAAKLLWRIIGERG